MILKPYFKIKDILGNKHKYSPNFYYGDGVEDYKQFLSLRWIQTDSGEIVSSNHVVSFSMHSRYNRCYYIYKDGGWLETNP